MSMGNVSDAIATTWLTQLQSSAVYAAVHFDIPNWADPGSSECNDPGYARQRVTWTFNSAREIVTATPLVYPALLETSVAAVGLWTASLGGTMVAYASTVPGNEMFVANLATLTLGAGEVSISV